MKLVMNKIHISLTIMIALAVAAIFYLHFSGDKVAYVDSNKLLNDYQGMIDARTTYQQKSVIWKANIDTLNVEVQRAINDYKVNSGSMTDKEKAVTQELIHTKQKQLAEYQKALNEKAAQEDSQLTSNVISEVNAYIKRYGDQHGYKIILVANQYGNIAYAEEEMDITEIILEGLNQEYKGQ